MMDMVKWVCIMHNDDVEYVGEYDMTEWEEGYERMYADAMCMADEKDTEVAYMCPDDFLVELIARLVAVENKTTNVEWKKPNRRFSAQTVLYEADDSNEFDELRQLVEKNPESFLLRSLYEGLQKFLGENDGH